MNRREVLGALTASAAGLVTVCLGAKAFAVKGHEHETHFEECAKA